MLSRSFCVERSDFLYLQHETGMNKGTLSSHLSRLEEAGYVEVTKTYRGKVPQTLLRLTGVGRKAFEQYRRKAQRSTIDIARDRILGVSPDRPVR
jgi:DNA-binding MarR family transcriptional regulator